MNRKIPYIIISVCLGTGLSAAAQSLSLEDCLSKAQESSVKVENARLDVESARADRSIAFSKYFPQVSLNSLSFAAVNPLISYGIKDIDNAALRNELYLKWYEDGKAMGIPNKIEELDKGTFVGVTAMQPVYAGGQIAAGNALAEVGVEAAQLQEEIALRDLLLEVEESYFLVSSLKAKKATVVSALALLDTAYRVVNAAVSAGVATSSDLVKVKIRKREMESNLLSIDEGIALATMSLCRVCGMEYSDSLQVSDTLSTVPESPYDLYVDETAAVDLRSETKLLGLNVKAQKLQKKMAVGAALPTVAIGGGMSYSNFLDRNNTNALAFVTVKVPITAWWENSRKIKKADIALRKAENMLDDTQKLLELQTVKTWNELLKAWRDVELKEDIVADVRDNYHKVFSNYTAGYSTVSDLLEAQLMLQSAESDRCDALIAYSLKKREYVNYTE